VRHALAAALLATAAEIPFLISPRPPAARFEELCVRDFTIWGPVHVTANCDAAEYLRLANRPGLMLTPGAAVAQNRPLYSCAGWLLALPFRALGFDALSERLIGKQVRPGSDEARYVGYAPEYAAFLLFNWLLLVAAALLLRRLLGAEGMLDTCMVLPLTALLVNEVTKAFFWTPHVQILNVLVPLLSMQLLVWIQSHASTTGWGEVAIIGASLGVASLMYGVFAMTVSAVALYLVLWHAPGAMRTRLPLGMTKAMLLLATFFAPVVAWSMLVTAQAGSFFSPETARYRQFIWIADSLAQGPTALFSQLGRHLTRYIATFPGVVAFPAATIAALRIAALMHDEPTVARRTLGRAILCVAVATVTFYGLMGYYASRLTWAIAPVLFMLIGVEIALLQRSLSEQARPRLRFTVATVALCYAVYWYARAGPYS